MYRALDRIAGVDLVSISVVEQAAGLTLVPLAALGALLMAVSAGWARRIGPVVAVVAAAGAGAGWAAGVVTTGDTIAVVLGLLLAIAASGLWLLDRGIPGNRKRPWGVRALALMLAVCGVAAGIATLSSPV